jgi:hypothetical protein
VGAATTVATWDVLPGFGFAPDAAVISDVMPGLSLDFGNLKVSASAVMGKQLQPVVLFTGWLTNSRTTAEVCFELPRAVASRDQLAAFIVHYLDEVAVAGVFQPVCPVPWLDVGRHHRHLLPWEANLALYQARPRCVVQRAWLRLALKDLAALLQEADGAAPVAFAFDGSVLRVQCVGRSIALAAEGRLWDIIITIPAESLRRLPQRFSQERIEISYWEESLHIGRCRFGGAKEVTP